jgi:hypothetical protein
MDHVTSMTRSSAEEILMIKGKSEERAKIAAARAGVAV